MDTALGLLGLTVSGIGSYALGKYHGNKDGYNKAKNEDNKLVRWYQVQYQNIVRENAELHGQKDRLIQENEILKSLLSQQPNTPQSEAILKSLKRVELRLTEALPSVLNDGEDHQTQMN